MKNLDIKNLGVDLTFDNTQLDKVFATPIKVYATVSESGNQLIRTMFQLDSGDTVISNFSANISRYSPIVKLIKACNNGIIPDRIDDLEELIVGKPILLDLKLSDDGEYLNPVKYYSVA